ncbi:hypothetical protein EVAR_19028_1 [Eumeta japonica]|uniref:Uncharacterized protein n=1 Tax=Eumeta variegata TaxID=151549 RepID=A0A4C1V8J5_EUMVA|nr:hypothetical protein EVAR_19028_1 [Eumeta japonica]
MELEGGHRNSVIKRRNSIEFGLVFNDAKEEPRRPRPPAAARARRLPPADNVITPQYFIRAVFRSGRIVNFTRDPPRTPGMAESFKKLNYRNTCKNKQLPAKFISRTIKSRNSALRSALRSLSARAFQDSGPIAYFNNGERDTSKNKTVRAHHGPGEPGAAGPGSAAPEFISGGRKVENCEPRRPPAVLFQQFTYGKN